MTFVSCHLELLLNVGVRTLNITDLRVVGSNGSRWGYSGFAFQWRGWDSGSGSGFNS
jgi:hypothetical protein